MLAVDPVSLYRTWPSQLMDKIDAIDHDALRRGSERYMADLRETEKEMQTLVGFWRDCGLITGERTPSSTTNSSPKESKEERPRSLHSTLPRSSTTENRQVIGWKKQRSPPLSPDEASLDDTPVSEDSTHLSNQSSATTADIAPPNIDATTSQSSPVITSGKSLQPLESQPKKLGLQSQKAGADVESVLRKSLWYGRLRPRKALPNSFSNSAEKPQGTIRRSRRKTPRNLWQPSTNA